MGPSKEKLFPVLLGAVPVILVLMLAVFVLFSGSKGLPTQNDVQNPSQPATVNSPMTGSTPTSSPASGGHGGGSTPLCLPMIGCLG